MQLQSEKLEKITPALIGARKEIYGAVKNGKGNWGKYASLEDIIEAINEPLLAHDIFVSQASTPHDDGFQYIVTQATHVSGQFMRSYTKMELAKAGDPQKALASQTYTRRAGLEALFNIPRVDDDGEYGNSNHNQHQQPNVKFITKEQQLEFVALITDRGISQTEAVSLLKAHDINKSAEIPSAEFDSIMNKAKCMGEVTHA